MIAALTFITSRAGRWLAVLVAAAVIVGGIFRAGRQAGQGDRATEYVNTSKRMTDAETGLPSDPADMRQRLQDRRPGKR